MRARVMLIVAVIVTVAWGCDEGAPPPTSAALRDTADQVLYGVTYLITIEGIKRIRLFSDTVYFYQPTQIADLVGVRVEFFSALGALSSTVTAEEGRYEWRTGSMEARSNVVATTPDDRRLTTEILRYDRTQERISGPSAFVFDSPDRHLEGDGFTADPDFRQVEALRPRQGRITERPERR
ncbi:MAG: LPS export ABC transporter periplasmic protein LptC [Gemmatimonadota bacterium]|nr:LPS export ABC transporter periplasmic protein LptC [Gemmatimonadota bacterium]MDH3369066.1 LPS export ABC transporter periplasmic protein LptC [Gemmatimonadota bacterium]MDH3477143.1 LPS export ABC transporter periplasmic protein LptC [Gemmatimonadota bacterium]MDH3571727.1 LPS export ABC transporter periplasmic protein LptC [Gemmatimonadota bacterium]MDH5550470.1 LPS export ABC transporter periplasmic protein LptC [Gemmatimonadota bacterium]